MPASSPSTTDLRAGAATPPPQSRSRVRRWLDWAKRHPRSAYALYLVALGGTAVVAAEILLRLVVRIDPSYYVAYSKARPGTVLHYPYGDIRFNQDGFPDDEFAPVKTRPRIAYVGDSVCYGVGAGHGHRVSELLEPAFPEFEHMNLSRGLGGSVIDERKTLELVERFDLDVVVYLMNLNDILPYDSATRAETAGRSEAKILRLRYWTDWLRGRSYLYTYARLGLKNYYSRRGFEVHGHKAYELFPERNRDVIAATAARINHLDRALTAREVVFLVLILPYEMQVSEEAARTYARLGITWEGDTFLDRGPQRVLETLLPPERTIDLYEAFVGLDAPAADRQRNRLGQYFVYNAGDKLDWNHPNREGHRRIADYLARSAAFRSVLTAASRDEQAVARRTAAIEP